MHPSLLCICSLAAGRAQDATGLSESFIQLKERASSELPRGIQPPLYLQGNTSTQVGARTWLLLFWWSKFSSLPPSLQMWIAFILSWKESRCKCRSGTFSSWSDLWGWEEEIWLGLQLFHFLTDAQGVVCWRTADVHTHSSLVLYQWHNHTAASMFGTPCPGHPAKICCMQNFLWTRL